MKSKNIFLILFLIVLSSNFVYAQECDYIEYKYYDEIIERIHDSKTNDVLGNALLIDDFRQDSDKHPSFKISNTLQQEITIEVNYTQIVRGKPLHKLSKIITIPINDFARLRGAHGYDSYYNTYIDLESISYLFIEPKSVLSKDKIRLNKSICINCNSNEIFCKKKDECITKSSVPLNVKPECGLYQECVSQYIDSYSGLCEKSPAQIQEEEKKETKFMIYSIIGLASLIFISLIAILILKNKTEKEIQKTLQKEIELESKKIESKEFELNDLNNQIKEIEKQKHKTIQEIEELENKKSKGDELIQYIENQYEKITKPFPDAQANNRMVVINPYLGGYKCFFKEGINLKDYPISSLLHRWVWKKHNGRYPKQGYHIHHIDEDKYNNNPRNLEEIEGKEHYENHRNQ